jgi:Tat protein translocase TatB subunit
MSLLGMGSMELVVILIIAMVVFGPERLAEIAGQAGKMLRDFRRMTRDVTGEFEQSMAPMRSVMDEMKTTVAGVERETREMAASVTDITGSAAADVRAGVSAVGTETASAAAAASGTTANAPQRAPGVVTPLRPAAKPTKEDPLADLDEFDVG